MKICRRIRSAQMEMMKHCSEQVDISSSKPASLFIFLEEAAAKQVCNMQACALRCVSITDII